MSLQCCDVAGQKRRRFDEETCAVLCESRASIRSKGYAGLCMWSLCSDFAGQSLEAADREEICEQLYASFRLSAMSERAELEFGAQRHSFRLHVRD